jgi:hypothetical protein
MCENSLFNQDVWMDDRQRVWVKFKKDEWIKIGKVPRVIGDLGVAASLQGAWLCEFMKEAMSKMVYSHQGFEFQFVKKPDHAVLTDVFRKLLNPTDRGYMAYFSDDSCLSVLIDGVVRTFNLDIASCDASHGAATFQFLIDITPPQLQKEMIDLIEQCARMAEVRNPSDPRSKVYRIKLRMVGEERTVLYSGSVITTLINNLANLLIGISISRRPITCVQDILDAARQAGYVITVDECHKPEDIQFLKHSPTLDASGAWVPVLNIGVLLRASGSCHGDIPGKSKVPLKDRAMSFQKSLLQGMYPRLHTPLIDNMKSVVKAASHSIQCEAIVQKDFTYKVTETEEYSVHTEDLLRRYDLTQHERDFLIEQFSFSDYGEISCHSALDKVLNKDYGITTTNECRDRVFLDYFENSPLAT